MNFAPILLVHFPLLIPIITQTWETPINSVVQFPPWERPIGSKGVQYSLPLLRKHLELSSVRFINTTHHHINHLLKFMGGNLNKNPLDKNRSGPINPNTNTPCPKIRCPNELWSQTAQFKAAAKLKAIATMAIEKAIT